MAQQSTRRDPKNQNTGLCLERVCLIWIGSANSHTGQQHPSCNNRPDRWQHPIVAQLSRFTRLLSVGRPQISVCALA